MATFIIENISAKFDDIPVGSVFEYFNNLYMKLEDFVGAGEEDYNVVNLDGGHLTYMFGTESVRVAREIIVRM